MTTPQKLVFITIVFAAILIRFYNFPDRITFGPEQARSLYVSASYIKEKPSLLGQEYFRVNSLGHKMFSGAIFNYSLVPLLLILNYDPIPVTAYFGLLNLITGIIFYILIKKVFGISLALISLILFVFNSTMIYHSMFIWNYNYLPLVGIISTYLLYKFYKKPERFNTFLQGIVNGIGISLQILFLPILIFNLIAVVVKSKRKVIDLLVFIIGIFSGNLPMLIFDLKHDFYHTKTLSLYFLDTLKGNSDASFSYYYLLPLWPLFLFAIAYILWKISVKYKYVSNFLILLYIVLNISSPSINFNKPTGMEDGMKYMDVYNSARIISRNTEGDFNVVSLLDFDKRGYILRYPLKYMFRENPLGDEDYKNTNVLYSLSIKDFDFNRSEVWEVKSVCPCATVTLGVVGGGKYEVTKLEKI